jgi:hypothetical protein
MWMKVQDIINREYTEYKNMYLYCIRKKLYFQVLDTIEEEM